MAKAMSVDCVSHEFPEDQGEKRKGKEKNGKKKKKKKERNGKKWQEKRKEKKKSGCVI